MRQRKLEQLRLLLFVFACHKIGLEHAAEPFFMPIVEPAGFIKRGEEHIILLKSPKPSRKPVLSPDVGTQYLWPNILCRGTSLYRGLAVAPLNVIVRSLNGPRLEKPRG
jgi:hypothetical protein